MSSRITEQDIKHRFGFHKATIEGPEATGPQHAELRQLYIEFAKEVVARTDPGREQSLALTALQEASMWTHAAVAMNAPLVEG